MSVGIAEVDARAAELPLDTTFDFNSVLAKLRFPRGQLLWLDAEREMRRPRRIVGRYQPIRRPESVLRLAAIEEKENTLTGHIERHESLGFHESLESEQLAIESRQPREVVGVERRFENSSNGWHYRNSTETLTRKGSQYMAALSSALSIGVT